MPAPKEKGGTVAWIKSFCKTNLTNPTHHGDDDEDSGQTAQDRRTPQTLNMLLYVGIFCLLVTPALQLDCYVCGSSTTNDACNQNSQTCQTIHDTCMTTVDILGTAKAIVKQCSSKATCNGAAASASTDANGNGNIITCCSAYNLCNFSGAQSIRAHPGMLLSLTAAPLMLLLLMPH